MLPFPKGCQLLPPFVLQIMEGHRFCGVEDEPRGEVTFSRQLSLHCSVAVCADCAVPASEVVGRDVPRGQGGRNGRVSWGLWFPQDASGGPRQPWKSKICNPGFSLLLSLTINQVSSMTINENGSVIQDAVRGGKIDFLRLLLEHGCDPWKLKEWHSFFKIATWVRPLKNTN